MPPPWPFHVLLVSTGLVVLSAAMLTARYMKDKRWWLKAHRSLGPLGAFVTLAGFATAVIMVRIYMGTLFINETHAYLGFSIAAMAIITPSLGFMQLRVKDKRMRIIHRWAGRITIVLMLINIAGGWLMISSGMG